MAPLVRSGAPRQLWLRHLIFVVAASGCVAPAWARWIGNGGQTAHAGQVLGAASAGGEWIPIGNSYCSKKGETVAIQEDSTMGFRMTGQECRDNCTRIPECKLYTYGRWEKGLPPPGGYRTLMRCQLYTTCEVQTWYGMVIWQKPASLLAKPLEKEASMAASSLVEVLLAMVCIVGTLYMGFHMGAATLARGARMTGTLKKPNGSEKPCSAITPSRVEGSEPGIGGISPSGMAAQQANDEGPLPQRPLVAMVESSDGRFIIDLTERRSTSRPTMSETPSRSARSRPSLSTAQRSPRSEERQMQQSDDEKDGADSEEEKGQEIVEDWCCSDDLSQVPSPSQRKKELDEDEKHARAG